MKAAQAWARFLLGSGAFVWEVGFDPQQRLWVIVVAIWLLGAPIEQLVALLSSGRLAITIRKNGKDDDGPGSGGPSTR